LMVPSDLSNGQKYIAENNNLVSINSSVENDFLGHVSSVRIGDTYYSSTGGHSNFAKAVNLSKNGRGIIAMYSTAAKDKISTIVPQLHPGAPMTTHKNDEDMVITEYGIAHHKNKTISERVEQLISVAHSDFREELRKQAIEMNYITE